MISREIDNFARPAVDPQEKPPPTNVRYFYAASVCIDDSQAPVPPPLANPSTAPRYPLRPFSDYDNTSLDRAWNALRRTLLKFKEEKDVLELKAKVTRSRRSSSVRSQRVSRDRRGASTSEPSKEQGRSMNTWPKASSVSDNQSTDSRRGSGSGSGGDDSYTREGPKVGSTHRPSRLRETFAFQEVDPEEQGLTGTPFARAPSRTKISTPMQRMSMEADDWDQSDGEQQETPNSLEEPSTRIPVGVSRLHQVVMPNLQLEPIYWNPVHDIAAVIRATWFYKDTMLPVEVEVANMLERGYLDLRPWTDTWIDELNSAVEAGAIGEQKIAHQLWPEHTTAKPASRPSTAMGSSGLLVVDEDTPETRRRDILDAARSVIDVSTSGLDVDNKASGDTTVGGSGQKSLYIRSQVIYANEREAYILRQSLQPSSYYGRRPLANYIKKGHKLGICVVRGFDQKQWNKLNPSPTSNRTEKLHNDPYADLSLSRTSRGQVSDLVLVIHGIGQKLSERVESFHFTHAMNAFRREVNVEMETAIVKQNLRKDAGGIMVLPVNWRSVLSFEDGGYKDGPGNPAENQYTLEDITPESLPSVRSIISDVMLDIPYYLSHHQPKMISAVIIEANRIYRTWCKNNPGFEKHGRVHIIAHSLGSVMALDVLSRQPTSVDSQLPKEEDFDEHFIFDTKNLFLCGSPAGFFLLLQKANLLPRKNRNKPSSDGDDWAPGVAGEQGEYGCVAVDNIYNIVNPYDPVAYRLNAAVDAPYATSLKPSVIPSATSSWLGVGNPFKSAPAAGTLTLKRPPNTQRLPSNVELDMHNFTREEIAEKRAFLLNDNGQIDYFLKYGGGLLEIQYLTMLGAHSSYWTSRDFVRFIVLETGRTPGKEGTLAAMRAVKKKAYAV